MGSFEQLSEVMGGLKGAPASVVLTLMLAGRPLSQGELLLLTGFSAKPVRAAVRALLALGVVYRDGPRALCLSVDWYQKAATNAAGREESAGHVDAQDDDSGSGERQPGALSPASAAESAVTTTEMTGQSAGEALKDPEIGQKGPQQGSFGPIQQQTVVVAVPDQTKRNDQQQQQIPESAATLAALLRQMGVSGRAFWRLVDRVDLAEQPELARAWWWYYRTQEGVRNPTGAAISRLDAHDRPPEAYLALARLWPAMPDEIREELESMVLYNWPAEQIAARLRPECPGLTLAAVKAYMALIPEELGSW